MSDPRRRGPGPSRQNPPDRHDLCRVRRIPRSPCCPDLLAPDRVLPFHQWFPPACAQMQAQQELRSLVADPFTVLVDGRLVVATQSRGDPGGFPV